MRTTFRQLLESGKKFTGTYIMSPCSTEIEAMKLAGVDFLIFDLEHEQLTFSEILPMLRTCDACGMATMVRVPCLDEGTIKKALDIGASAIKVPGISSAAEARKAVSFCKYPPDGVRGACPFVRCNNYATEQDRGACYERANKETVVSVIIEGIEGVNRMEEIIATPGIDCISIGNVDLSVALGVPGQVFHPKVKRAVLDCAELCFKYGKSCSAQIKDSTDAEMFKYCKGISHYHLDLLPTMVFKVYNQICTAIKN